MAGNDRDETGATDTSDDSAVEEAEIMASDDSEKPAPTDTHPARESQGGSGVSATGDSAMTGQRSLKDRFLARRDRIPALAVRGLIFGIIAAIAGVLTAAIWQNRMQGDTTPPDSVTTWQARIPDLEDRIATLESQTADDRDAIVVLQALAADLEAARSLLAGFDPDNPELFLPALEALRAAQSELAERQARLEAAGASGLAERQQIADAVTALNQALEKIRQQGPAGERMPGGTIDQAAGMGRADGGSGTPVAAGPARQAAVPSEAMVAMETALANITDELATLEPRLDDLDQALTTFAGIQAMQRADLDQARTRLSELTARMEADRQDRGIALFNLGVAIETGAPYQTVLDDLRIGGTDLPPVLGQHAATGVPTVDELLVAFDALARVAVQEDPADGTSGLVRGVRQYVSSLITIRPLRPQEGTTTQAVLSRARFALEGGNLETALVILDELQPAAAAIMADWVASATARMQGLGALQSLIEDIGGLPVLSGQEDDPGPS